MTRRLPPVDVDPADGALARRAPVQAVLAAAAGLVLAVALQLQQERLWPAGACVGFGLLALLGLAALRRWPRAMLGLALLTGFCAGAGLTGARALHQASQVLAPDLEGQSLRVTGRVSRLPQSVAQGYRFEFRIEQAERADGQRTGALRLPDRVQLGWRAYPGQAPVPPLQAGDRWQFVVRLAQPHGLANPNGFDREAWLWEQGIGATGHVRNGRGDEPPRFLGPSGWHPVERVRQRVGERIARQVDDARSAGVLAALAVGDQGAIERSDWALFRATGVAHLVSISGLHVTLFAWLAARLVGALWRRLGSGRPGVLLAVPAPVAADLGGVALAAAYALLAGWGVPAQRTLAMLALVVGLRLAGRRWPWPAVWLAAMVLVLLGDPWALRQPGFWLSFVAVALLFAGDAGKPARQRDGALSLPRRAWVAASDLLRVQLRLTLALAPLSLLLFGQVSLVGLLANLLAVPWVTLVVTPLALAGVLLPVAWDLAAGAVQALVLVLQALAAWPFATVYRAIPPLPLALAGLAGASLLVLRLPWVARLSGLALLWPVLAWTPARPAVGEFELLAMDVGQGSAVLLRTASHSLLYDTGPRYSPQSDAGDLVVVPLLRALGESPDAVVVSHRDSDHAGGAAAVRAAFGGARWLSSVPGPVAERCLAGQRWTWDGVDFEVLHPLPEHYGPDGQGRLPSNAMSCVLRVDNGRQSAWLSGDLDAERETRLALARPELRAGVLLAPHHGSRSSSSPVLLNTLRPHTVLVQAGHRNAFGHPAPEVLDRYRARGLRWAATPDCGAITWQSQAPAELHCERAAWRRYWHHRDPARVADRPLWPDDGEGPPESLTQE